MHDHFRKLNFLNSGLHLDDRDINAASNTIIVFVDISNRFPEDIDRTLCLAISQIRSRMFSGTYRNPVGPPNFGHGRLAIAVDTKTESPEQLFLEIEQLLLKAQTRMQDIAAESPDLLNFPIVEDIMTISWVTGGW